MKIEEDVYSLKSTKGSYSYLIKDKETILIDTGNPGKFKNILKEIKSLNINPKDINHILLTHHDVITLEMQYYFKKKQEQHSGHQN